MQGESEPIVNGRNGRRTTRHYPSDEKIPSW